MLKNILVLFTFAATVGFTVSTVEASAVDELKLDLARVCVNEAGWSSPNDCALIWQVVSSQRRTTSSRLAWLRAHSSRATGQIESSTGNSRWTPGLTWSSRRPEGWPEDVHWRLFVSRWRSVREFVSKLVDGEIDLRPCEIDPTTWGGPMDHEGAIRRGLVPIRCVETRNTGYVPRSTSIPVSVIQNS